MLGPICQKDDDRSRHNLAHGQTTGRGIGPKLPYNVGRDLERDRDGRLDPWHAVPDRLSFAEIAIGLASREREIARQHLGYLRRAGSEREQSMDSVQSLGFLGVGGSRHVTYTCYRLRLRSRVEHERQPFIIRSNWKLPFAYRASLPHPAGSLAPSETAGPHRSCPLSAWPRSSAGLCRRTRVGLPA